eukprot:NODE_3121_length_489_cov_236.484091_g2706_i0.p2 GENE.NODE_3121_length_489_cov_236.484091_g2706_i0~~NODE_3121_length_489_cov_236.484091_g2706_i0.p2  ORF type:complete len:92 (+),score=28.44 NODE_3121_length_489_cov_236.484091_g2706_i0:32-277(+)
MGIQTGDRCSILLPMGTPRNIRAKVEKHSKGIERRGEVKETKSKIPVGPVVLGVLLFVVIGSALLQIIANARTAFNSAGDE